MEWQRTQFGHHNSIIFFLLSWTHTPYFHCILVRAPGSYTFLFSWLKFVHCARLRQYIIHIFHLKRHKHAVYSGCICHPHILKHLHRSFSIHWKHYIGCSVLLLSHFSSLFLYFIVIIIFLVPFFTSLRFLFRLLSFDTKYFFYCVYAFVCRISGTYSISNRIKKMNGFVKLENTVSEVFRKYDQKNYIQHHKN